MVDCCLSALNTLLKTRLLRFIPPVLAPRSRILRCIFVIVSTGRRSRNVSVNRWALPVWGVCTCCRSHLVYLLHSPRSLSLSPILRLFSLCLFLLPLSYLPPLSVSLCRDLTTRCIVELSVDIIDVSQTWFEKYLCRAQSWPKGRQIGQSIGELMEWHLVLSGPGEVTLLAVEVSVVLLDPRVCFFFFFW